MRFLILILLLYNARDIYTYHCDVKPRGASGIPNEKDGRFIIEIVTTPERYIPDAIYNVTLMGKRSLIEDPIQFNGFSITVQPSNMEEIGPILDRNIAGGLEVYPGDVSAKIDEKCPNMVIHTSHMFVNAVTVKWKAPPAGSGCVIFQASVMEQNVWYRNNGSLMNTICEDENTKSDDDVEECKVCSEAKYELKFEGLWTRQSHPLYFPSNVWDTRFSDVIGASHGASYRFWKENELASEGLKEFLEKENTTTLETEIKSNETRTVIKAKGLRYPNIPGKTFAVFRVDHTHHLLSIISLIIPSPDWFVGVSGLELCNKTEWIPNKTISLYPYDLGLYADFEYTSRTQQTNLNITKIDHATEYASPFHTNYTEIPKPLAKIHLTRSRVYERLCNPEEPVNTTPRESSSCVDGNCSNPCDLNLDTPWSECSSHPCDSERVRGRFPDWTDDKIKECQSKGYPTEQLRTEGCYAQCASKELENLNGLRFRIKASCPLSKWTPFSPCDKKTCYRVRNRTLTNEADKLNRNCAKLVVEQKIKCDRCSTDDQKKKGFKVKYPNKKDISISAIYSYTVLHNTKLCNATNNTSTTNTQSNKSIIELVKSLI